MLRQGFVNCRPGHTERIGGLYLSGRLAGASCEEISDELCRCVPVGTAQAIGGRLAGALELDAGERVIVGRSSGVTLTSRAAFALRPSRALRLAPLTHRWPCSEEAATTCPPGHMQNENTLRPLGRWATSL